MKKTILYDAREYAKWWFFKVNGKQTSFNTFYLDYVELVNTFRFENPDTKFRGIPQNQLLSSFEEYTELTLEEERMATIKKFNSEIENLEPVDTWLKAVTGTINKVDRSVIAHWIWSVKRKASNKPVRYQIMPVVFGPQGGGKSEALSRLISPIERLRMNMRMNQLGDERTYQGYARHLVVLFDELQGIERTDLNVLKNQITTEKNTYRKLRTHDMVSVPMSCSFIGATNKHLNESFSDSTGMRRFYELTALKKCDWDTINSIDYAQLWKGIDEKRENGYMTVEALEQLNKAQASLVQEDDIEMFIKEHNMPYFGTEYKTLSLSSAYKAYEAWASDNNLKYLVNKIVFSKKLINREIPNFTERDKNSIERRYFKVNKDCTILELSGNIINIKKES